MFKCCMSNITALAKSQADSCSQLPLTDESLNSFPEVNIESRKSGFPNSGTNTV